MLVDKDINASFTVLVFIPTMLLLLLDRSG